MEDQFELSVLDAGDQTRAIAVARCGMDMAVESFSGLQLQALFDFHAKLSAAAAGRAPVKPTAPELTAFGQALFGLLVRGSIKSMYDRLPNSHVRLQIYSNRPDLQAIPWEYIQDPAAGAPGPNAMRSVVRVVPTIGVPAPTPKPLGATVRMLFVYAEPPRAQSVDWLTIKSSIEAEFTRKLPRNFVLDLVEGATTESFLDALRGKTYDILHMVCHGQVEADGTGSLLFQDIKGKGSDSIAAGKLGAVLKDKELRLVVLSACNTAAGDFSKAYAVVAKTLVESGVPAVVANQFEITNKNAALFAGAFYAELLSSGDIDRATTKGRVELDFGGRLPNDAARIDWGIPTLFRHLGAARTFKP
jgi:hypothetical protein